MDILNVKNCFPALKIKKKRKLIYLDNAATTQLPESVMKKLIYSAKLHANINRGVYFLSAFNTEQFNVVREKVKKFINAECTSECIFVRGTTEAINLVATSYGQEFIKAGDEILLTVMEHHANIIPWQILCKRVGASIKYLPLTLSGDLDLSNLPYFITRKTKFISVVYASNTLGTINDVRKIIKYAHMYNIPVLVDGAQAISHFKIDVQNLDCDFFTFSAHKMYGPTGVGVLFGKKKYLNIMLPYQSGGGMIENMTLKKSIYKELPYKFEAGTPNITNILAFGTTIDFLNTLDFCDIEKHENFLTTYTIDKLSTITGLHILGKPQKRIGVISFVLGKIHAHDVCTIVDEKGIALRSGQHCTIPIMKFYKVNSTTRVSLGIYNNLEDIDFLYDSILYVKKIFKL